MKPLPPKGPPAPETRSNDDLLDDYRIAITTGESRERVKALKNEILTRMDKGAK